MAVELEETLGIDEKQRQERVRVRQEICICGHPLRRHHVVAGYSVCKPSRMECPCRTPRSVLVVGDSRPFLRKTSGIGSRHALARGLAGLIEKEKEFHWLEGMSCDRCEQLGREPESGGLVPVSVTMLGGLSDKPERTNSLLCIRCVGELS